MCVCLHQFYLNYNLIFTNVRYNDEQLLVVRVYIFHVLLQFLLPIRGPEEPLPHHDSFPLDRRLDCQRAPRGRLLQEPHRPSPMIFNINFHLQIE